MGGGGLALSLWVIQYLRCLVRSGSQQVGGAGDSSPNPAASVTQLVAGGGGGGEPAPQQGSGSPGAWAAEAHRCPFLAPADRCGSHA